jgi:hypothetical protein
MPKIGDTIPAHVVLEHDLNRLAERFAKPPRKARPAQRGGRRSSAWVRG